MHVCSLESSEYFQLWWTTFKMKTTLILFTVLSFSVVHTTGSDYGPPTQTFTVDSGMQETWQPLSKTVRHFKGTDSSRMLETVRVEYFEQDGFKDIICLDFTYPDRPNQCPDEGSFGTRVTTYEMEYDEYIVEISGNAKPFLSRVEIRTNKGVLGVWGQPESKFHTFSLSNDEKPLLQVDLHLGVWLYDITCVFSDIDVMDLRPTTVDVAKEMFEIIRTNIHGVAELDNKYKPTAYYDLATKGCRRQPITDTSGTKVACQLKTLLEQINVLTMTGAAKRQHQPVNLVRLADFDNRAFLDQISDSRDFHQLVTGIRLTVSNAIDVTVETAQTLGNYFTQVGNFDKQVAVNDVAYFAGKLKNIKDGYTPLAENVKSKIKIILTYALGLKVANIVEAVVMVVNGLFDMVPWGSMKSFNKAMDYLGSVINDVIELSVITHKLKAVSRFVSNIIAGYNNNDNHIVKLRNIADNFDNLVESGNLAEQAAQYIKSYGDYSPGVTPEDVAELAELFGNMVESACEFIREDGTTASKIIAGIVQTEALHHCMVVDGDIARLNSFLSQMLGMQFELIDALTIQSKNSIAERMAGAFLDIRNNLDIGTCAIGATMVEIKYQAAARERCDLLEYTSGGLRDPDNCQQVLFTRDDFTRIKRHTGTLSTNPKKIEAYVPTTNTSVPFIDVDALLSGAPQVLDITQNEDSTKWLKDHMWLPDSYNVHTAFYVRSFEVYVPDAICQESGRQVHVYVRATPSARNRLYREPAAAEYILHRDQVNFEYKADLRSCETTKIETYTTKNSALPVNSLQQNHPSSMICVESKGTVPNHKNEEHTYPSLFTTWTITMHAAAGCTLIRSPDYTFKPMVTVQLEVDELLVTALSDVGANGVDECWPAGSRCTEAQECVDKVLSYECVNR